MSRNKSNISTSLTRAHKAIDNTLKSPAILKAVTPFGYSAEHMQAGMAVYESAVAAVHARTAAAGAQKLMGAHLKRTEKTAFAAYQTLSEVAKAIYRKAPEKLATIGLDRPMPRTTAPFLVEAFKLFDNASLKAELVDFGYHSKRLASERAKIVGYEQTYHEYQRAKGAAQHATQHQNSALETMKDWITQYLRIARAALRDQPQLLEKLGILVRSSKTEAQRNAPKKAAATRAARKAQESGEPEPELV